MKTCNCCHKELPLSAFSKYKRTKDGLARFCRVCKSEKDRVYSQSDKAKAKRKAWQDKEKHWDITPDTTRVCTRCKRELLLSSFGKSKTGKYGVVSRCRECMAIGESERRKTPKAIARIAAWKLTDSAKASRRRSNHTPNAIAATKRYHQTRAYKDAANARRKTPEYRAYVKMLHQKANYKAAIKRFFQSPKGRAWTKAWRQTPAGQASAARNRYKWRTNLRATLNSLTAEEWDAIMKRYKHRCVYCGEKKPLTMDHIIPLSKGGQHTKENIVPACRSCNSAKADRPVLLQLLVI